MKFPIVVLFSLVLCAACTPNQPKPTESSATTARSPEFLVRQSSFTSCELEAFISLGAARNAIVFGQTQETLLAANRGAFQTTMINELFARMKNQGFRDYPQFAAEKFYQCAEREKLTVAKDLNGASVCMSRQDIPFYLYARKTEGRTQADATAAVKKIFVNSSKEIYPEALIDQTAPMVYRITSGDGFYELRRFSFETCLFPTEWKAWWDTKGSFER